VVLAPVVPFLAEEAWTILGGPGSVHEARWPDVAPRPAGDDVIVVVQIDGRVRDHLHVPRGTSRDDLVHRARSAPRVRAALRDRPVGDVVVTPDRVVNFVTA
jgi:leucyl-tRNA synthetase